MNVAREEIEKIYGRWVLRNIFSGAIWNSYDTFEEAKKNLSYFSVKEDGKGLCTTLMLKQAFRSGFEIGCQEMYDKKESEQCRNN